MPPERGAIPSTVGVNTELKTENHIDHAAVAIDRGELLPENIVAMLR
jgi:hypothetical protein